MAEQKNWFITGCDSGMGYAVAETVLDAGHRVVATARDKSNVAELERRFGQKALLFTLDVTQPTQIREVVAAAEEDMGGIDVLLNNAGHGLLGAAEETTPDEYRAMFDVNFFGMAEVTRAILPGMRQRRRGHILSISSSSGYAAAPGSSFYAASKFAVEGFVHALAQEIEAFGIKAIIIEPGGIRTNFAGSSMRRARTHIDDYEHSAAAQHIARMAARDGAQPGDPRKVARALIQLTTEPKPPLRMPLGGDSFDRLTRMATEQLAEFRQWEVLARSIAFDQ